MKFTTKQLKSILDLAISDGNVALTRKLLDVGAKPDEGSLSYAINEGIIEIIQMILDAGAKPRDLNEAIWTGIPQVVQQALQDGWEPDDDSLKEAIETDNPEILKLVVKAYSQLL